MRFAILGDHPDGWAIARALSVSGRHQVVVYCGPRTENQLRPEWPELRTTADLEDVLSDPAVDAVIVAGLAAERVDQLRRVLQSERSAFCVHPVDRKPDGAYELNLLQGDVHQAVVPILPLSLNQAVVEFAETLREQGTPRLVEMELRSIGELLFDPASVADEPHFPGWEMLRRLGGNIAEVQAFAREESVHFGDAVTLQGRFESGVLFRAMYLPAQPEDRVCLSAIGPAGQNSAVAVTVGDNDWARLVSRFETATERLRATPRAVPGGGPAADPGPGPTWLDEVRAAELDDAARRGIERRRAVTLDYQEASEEVGFKGTMTLVGCGLIWLIPVLLVVSVWFPYIGWLIVPVLFGFLLLQLLRWFVPTPAEPPRS
jgi:hypothetical protein